MVKIVLELDILSLGKTNLQVGLKCGDLDLFHDKVLIKFLFIHISI